MGLCAGICQPLEAVHTPSARDCSAWPGGSSGDLACSRYLRIKPQPVTGPLLRDSPEGPALPAVSGRAAAAYGLRAGLVDAEGGAFGIVGLTQLRRRTLADP